MNWLHGWWNCQSKRQIWSRWNFCFPFSIIFHFLVSVNFYRHVHRVRGVYIWGLHLPGLGGCAGLDQGGRHHPGHPHHHVVPGQRGRWRHVHLGGQYWALLIYLITYKYLFTFTYLFTFVLINPLWSLVRNRSSVPLAWR